MMFILKKIDAIIFGISGIHLFKFDIFKLNDKPRI